MIEAPKQGWQTVKTGPAKYVEPLPYWLCIITEQDRREWLRGVYLEGKAFNWM